MLRLALLLIVPCLISADATCPDGKTTCPEGQVCCTVNDKQSCCDEAQLPLRPDVQAATINNSTVQNAFFGSCDTFSNCIGGTCCNSGCCRNIRLATCCANSNLCCPSMTTCCVNSGTCCPWMNTCCGGGCCDWTSTCCEGAGCCASNGKCCGSGTQRWCCKSNHRCGLRKNTCYAGAGALSPTTLVTLVAAWLVAYALKKM